MNNAMSLLFHRLLIGDILLEHSSLDSERSTACSLPLFLLVFWSRPVEYYKGSEFLRGPENNEGTYPAENRPSVVASSNGCKPVVCHVSRYSAYHLRNALTFEALM